MKKLISKETTTEVVKVEPLMSGVENGFGKVCVVVPASQMHSARAFILHLHGYGKIIVVGGDKALEKIHEVLAALDFDVQLKETIYPMKE